jgi:ABC-type dipeptide/oligopeptide/nickel transport system ATPase component
LNAPVLSARRLSVFMREEGAERAVVDAIDFDLHAGEVLALVGESGCGKSKTAEALMGLVPRGSGRVDAERIELEGQDLAGLAESELRRVRGNRISMVFQEPLTALDPMFTAGHQLATVFRRHRGQTRRQAGVSAQAMLARVGFADTARIMRSYPHELSGGMRQRVVIAMAMACEPRVLIADEPTTALDVTTQAQVLSQLVGLGRETGTAILLITHDLGVVAQYADRALVMRQGRILEEAAVDVLFARPGNPYTSGLISAARGLGA